MNWTAQCDRCGFVEQVVGLPAEQAAVLTPAAFGWEQLGDELLCADCAMDAAEAGGALEP